MKKTILIIIGILLFISILVGIFLYFQIIVPASKQEKKIAIDISENQSTRGTNYAARN